MFQEFKETLNIVCCRNSNFSNATIHSKIGRMIFSIFEFLLILLRFKNRETQINDLFWRFTPKVTRFPTIWSNIFLMPRKPRYWRSASILCNTYKAVKPDSQFFFPASMNCTKWLKHSISDPKMSWLHVD